MGEVPFPGAGSEFSANAGDAFGRVCVANKEVGSRTDPFVTKCLHSTNGHEVGELRQLPGDLYFVFGASIEVAVDRKARMVRGEMANLLRSDMFSTVSCPDIVVGSRDSVVGVNENCP
jgi:hypothetical protein